PTINPQEQPVQPLTPTINPQEQPVQPLTPTINPQEQPVQPLTPTINLQEQPVQPLTPTINPQEQPVQPLTTNQQEQPVQPLTTNQQEQPVQPLTTINQQAQPIQPLTTINQQEQPIQPTTINQQNQLTETQPIVQAQAQSIRVDERPVPQNFSELLGVNVQAEDAPTAAPVTPPQSTPQQFEQEPQQRDAQQTFQPFQASTDAPQPQQVSTGAEVFTVPLTTNDAPQPATAPVQAPDAPPMPQDNFDVPAQIVRQARLIRTAENTQMVIKLNPEHLGDLTLRISVSQSGAINASFHSDNAQVRTIIENSLVQLRQELNNAGLKVDNVEVSANLNDGGLMNGQGGQAWQQNRQSRQGNRRINLDTLERDVDAAQPVNESSATDGVDYSV
ncbi:MAG: flagellar hook-length control protein FliK, partial [Selenomonadaceae bacterium]|nr:flagellar hook-length control protein FliK [Selenomonadaceae bacterium]